MLTLMEMIVISPDADRETKIKLLERLRDGNIPQNEQEALQLMLMKGLQLDFNRQLDPIRNDPSLSKKEQMDKIKEIVWYRYLIPLTNGDKVLANDVNKKVAKAQEILDEIMAW